MFLYISLVWHSVFVAFILFDYNFLRPLVLVCSAIPPIPRIRLAGRDTVGNGPLSPRARSFYGGQNHSSCAVRNCCYNIRAVVISEVLDVFDYIFATLLVQDGSNALRS